MIIDLRRRFVAPARRLALRHGYRAPLAVAALLALLSCTPHGTVHGALTVAFVLGGFLWTLLDVLFLPVTVPLLVIVGLPAALLAIRHRKHLRRPARPGNSALLCCALGVAAVLLGASVPGQDAGLLGLGALTLLGLPVGRLLWQQTPWAHRTPHRTPSRTPHRSPSRTPRRAPGPLGRWRWAAAPLLLATGALLVHYDVPAGARFAATRPTLTAHAEHALATGDTAPARVAGYRLERTELVGGGVTFTVAGTGVFAPHGYAYFPHGTPVGESVTSYDALGDGWYSWSGTDHF
ncbi:hypothetical protein HUT16_06055 [Kitasatospora sp. NA04385]|uniref:hypothetical protein n=1 Tax=Kitasatospora sp. NA04385 TaxID=2742135 RepID=UPI001591021B|nr:hypothetical protein [Kitasatospora sp. NA04385]QKW18678.1 hypothetical protein HUT16_06055 [Kitasatospora sp. NA04385]